MACFGMCGGDSPVDDSIIVLNGKQLDLNVGDTQQRKLTIMALKPGQNTITVTFTNEKTGEYIFYRIVRNFVVGLTFLASGDLGG